jgi:HSP20 family protein
MYFEFQEQPRRGATWTPTVDVCERAAEIVIYAEMPGVDRSDVQVAWNEGLLIISGLKRQAPPGGGVVNYLCVERAHGHFRREIEIKVPVDFRKGAAELKNGLLKIQLPKRTEPDVATIPIL